MVSRVIPASRPALYAACCDPRALAGWRFPHDMMAKVERLDGNTYRMSLTYRTGKADTFEATFVERVPDEKVVERIRFDAADRPGEMVMTTHFAEVAGGTKVTITYESLPASISREDNEEGSRQALENLAKFVGAAI
ncbi:MAG: SRPBCC domain-containing protein [Proteobacteria bacterium]|nr:SRPBCC domain-containing protein [Pseudomonadota bacterium]